MSIYSICLYLYMSVCLYFYMSVCLYAYMSICLYVYMSICLYVCISICLYVYMSISLYVLVYSVLSYKKGVEVAERYLGAKHAICITLNNSLVAAKKHAAAQAFKPKPKVKGKDPKYAPSAYGNPKAIGGLAQAGKRSVMGGGMGMGGGGMGGMGMGMGMGMGESDMGMGMSSMGSPEGMRMGGMGGMDAPNPPSPKR
jgi:hypothetical protein